MKRREIKRVQAACVELMEAACQLKMYLPIFGSGDQPDWPIITDEVKGLRRHLARIEKLLGETQPVRGDDIQWRLTKHDMPDADLCVLVSIVGEDDACQAYYSDSDDGSEMVWRHAHGGRISGRCMRGRICRPRCAAARRAWPRLREVRREHPQQNQHPRAPEGAARAGHDQNKQDRE